jgi:hypothetical protein
VTQLRRPHRWGEECWCRERRGARLHADQPRPRVCLQSASDQGIGGFVESSAHAARAHRKMTTTPDGPATPSPTQRLSPRPQRRQRADQTRNRGSVGVRPAIRNGFSGIITLISRRSARALTSFAAQSNRRRIRAWMLAWAPKGMRLSNESMAKRTVARSPTRAAEPITVSQMLNRAEPVAFSESSVTCSKGLFITSGPASDPG